MSKKTYLFLLTALLCLSLSSFGQVEKADLVFKIGDTVPTSFWTTPHMFLKDGKLLKEDLSRLRGKFFIIDFWATWCIPCIQSFPEQQKLVSEFNGKFEIIRVSRESAVVVQKMYSSNKNPIGQNLTSIIEDKMMNGFFPHKVIPHLVWIDPSGKIANITEGDQLSSANLSSAIKGQFVATAAIPIFEQTPIFMSSNPSTMIASNTLFKGSVPGLGAGQEPRESGDRVGFLVKNSPLKWVYTLLAMKQFDWFDENPNRMMLDFPDKKAFVNERALDKENFYTVDFWVPKSKESQLFTSMFQFVNEYSGYSASARKIMTPAYVLKYERKPGNIMLGTKGAEKINRPFDPPFKVANCPLQYFLTILSSRKWWIGLPLVDETGIKEMIDIDLGTATASIDELNKKLKPYGLYLEKSERLLDMLVVTKANP